jgi:hypothetical protein
VVNQRKFIDHYFATLSPERKASKSLKFGFNPLDKVQENKIDTIKEYFILQKGVKIESL